MGVIQQSVNQGLSIAGFLYGQTDLAKNAQRKHQLERELKAEWGAREKRQESKSAKSYNPEETASLLKKERELYTLKPTEERLKSLIDTEDIHYHEVKDYKQEQKEIAEIEAEPARKKAEAEAREEEEKQISEQSAAASNVIQARIMNPFSIADEELQKAVATKNEINRRKGGMI